MRRPNANERHNQIIWRLDHLIRKVGGLDTEIREGNQAMAGELAQLQQEVAETKSVQESAVQLLQGLKAKLDEAIASGDPTALTALSAELDSSTNALADAIAANTPAA